jgi:hypothetical protein
MNYSYNLTEEICRWSFEVHIKKLESWWIAFTNPTAGPWKKIESYNKNNKKGEVFRYERDAPRPDLIIVNDDLKAIIIFEAKDDLVKLNIENQIEKTTKVVDDMNNILTKIDNEFWNNRNTYNTFLGLLWGSKTLSIKKDVLKTFKNYSDCLRKKNTKVNVENIIGIEVSKKNENIMLNFHADSDQKNSNKILNSLKS